MAQIRNRFDLQNSIVDEQITAKKKLPNFFNTKDDIGPYKGIGLSICAHIFLISLSVVISAIMGLVFPHLPKPELPVRDVEFKLVQNESKPPINKNTKIRSDRDSRAGGKHDPKRAISEPSPQKSAPAKPKVAQKQQPKVAKAPQKQVQKPVQKQVQKPVQKPVSKPVVAQKPVAKPSPIKAPTAAKPQVRPSVAPKAPSAPRIATAPKSPFNVPVAPSKAPVGSTYRPPASSGTSGGSSSGGRSTSPAPKFSAAGSSSRGGSSSGSSGSRYASRGSSGGYGSGGNPSPGNPNGAPGIDAIRQPNWGPYMRDLEQRIKRNWSPPKGDSSKRVVITFTIGRDGRLLSHRVTKSSGVPLADRAAMSAIELTAPFRPLPPEFKGQSVPIEFKFDYNVLNSVLR